MTLQNNEQAFIHGFGSPSSIVLEQSEVPEPKAGEVLVRVEASGICATDILIRKGIYPLLKEKPPFALGYDLVGFVVKTDENTTCQAGERVAALVQTGGNSRFLCIEASRLLRISTKNDATKAVCLPLNYMTAYQMLQQAQCLEKGKVVLVQGGSGAVGTALCQLGRHFGLKVVATASLHKQDYVRKQGAVAVDYRSEHLAKDLKGHAPDGYDAAFDAIGNKSFPRSFKLLNSRGTLITYGTLEKASAIEKKTFLNFLGFGWSFALMMLGNWCRNLWNGDKKAHFFGVVTSLEKDKEKFQRDLDFLVGLLESGAIKPEIHKELSLHEVKKGHEMYENGEVCGQLVINMYK